MSSFSAAALQESRFINMVINGQFKIDQINEHNNYTMNANGTVQGPDCFSFVTANRNALSLTAAAGDFGGAQSFTGLNINCVAAEPNPNNNELFYILHSIEGTNLAQLFNETSRWSQAWNADFSFDIYTQNCRGKFIGITFIAGDGGVFVTDYQLTADDSAGLTQQTVSVSIAQVNDASLGVITPSLISSELDVQIHLMPSPANAVTSTEMNVWSIGVGTVSPRVSNFFTTNGNNIYFSNVEFQKSINAGIKENRTYQEEFDMCCRYYQKSMTNYAGAPARVEQNFGIGNGCASYRAAVAGVSNGRAVVNLPERIRNPSTAVVTTYNPGAVNAKWRNVTAGTDSGVAVAALNGDNVLLLDNPQVAGDGAADDMRIGWTINSRLS